MFPVQMNPPGSGLMSSSLSSSQVTPVTRTVCLLAATCRAPRLSSPTTTPSRPPWTDTEQGWPTWACPDPPASSTAPPTLLTQVSPFKKLYLHKPHPSERQSAWMEREHTSLFIILGNKNETESAKGSILVKVWNSLNVESLLSFQNIKNLFVKRFMMNVTAEVEARKDLKWRVKASFHVCVEASKVFICLYLRLQKCWSENKVRVFCLC